MNFIINTILWVLAIYGVLEITKEIININKIGDIEKNEINHFILIHNQEEQIEGYLRSYVLKQSLDKTVDNYKIFLIDLNSEDNSLKIIQKLKFEFPEIEILSIDQAKDFLDRISVC